MNNDVTILSPYWILYCLEYNLDPWTKLTSYCDFTAWITTMHNEFQPNAKTRITPEYIAAFTTFLANRNMPKPTEADVLERLKNFA